MLTISISYGSVMTQWLLFCAFQFQ